MNRQTSSLLVLSFLPFSMFGQVNPVTKENVSLYQLSLMAYVEAKAEHGSTGDNIVVMVNSILNDSHVVEIFPPKIGSATVEYLTSESMKERHRRLGKDFPIVEILPMRNSHDLLVVGVAEYRVSVRHGKLILGVFGGYEVSWRFDCSKNEYVKVRVEGWPPMVL
jgi:hypothetical protein